MPSKTTSITVDARICKTGKEADGEMIRVIDCLPGGKTITECIIYIEKKII